jgi:hypothetical protein
MNVEGALFGREHHSPSNAWTFATRSTSTEVIPRVIDLGYLIPSVRSADRLVTLIPTLLYHTTPLVQYSNTYNGKMDDPKVLADVLQTVKLHATSLRRHLDQDQIMESLKSASSMLAELRTSSLGPKQYYELYMAVFDSLRHLSGYLAEAHAEGKHHLADLYELVQ